MKKSSFTEGKIYGPLLKFALPVLAALFLQSLYGAVDLMIVGQFSTPAEVSAVSTGSHIMTTFTNLIASLAMGVTVLIGQHIGKKEPEEAGKTVGASIVLFGTAGILLSAIMILLAPILASVMQAPEEALASTTAYIRICGGAAIIIIAYNMIGSIFRGIGNSLTPLAAVPIACAGNIAGDLLAVRVLRMGAAGAAAATALSQALSVLISFLMIRQKRIPFLFQRTYVKWNRVITTDILKIGVPIALQDLLVNLSFLFLTAIVNRLGVTASAGVGVAEKVCSFIMLMPNAFSQSITAFVSQNYGAGKMSRAWKGLVYAILTSFVMGMFLSYLSFFHGNILTGIFTKKTGVNYEAWEYLKAYALDCLITPLLFCMVGFFNGIGHTRFVMIQGVLSAFCVRIPLSWIMSCIKPVSLFRIGIAIPASSLMQATLCVIYIIHLRHAPDNP